MVTVTAGGMSGDQNQARGEDGRFVADGLMITSYNSLATINFPIASREAPWNLPRQDHDYKESRGIRGFQSWRDGGLKSSRRHTCGSLCCLYVYYLPTVEKLSCWVVVRQGSSVIEPAGRLIQRFGPGN